MSNPMAPSAFIESEDGRTVPTARPHPIHPNAYHQREQQCTGGSLHKSKLVSAPGAECGYANLHQLVQKTGGNSVHPPPPPFRRKEFGFRTQLIGAERHTLHILV
jgi:hypothetical protein